VQAEKKEKSTTRSSTFNFARTSQNKKSLPFPTTTHTIKREENPQLYEIILKNYLH
jgi:hypothetical protein